MSMPYPKPVFTTTVVDENGSIVASPTVAVYDQLSGALYPLYSVPTWAAKSNPFTGGADGLVQFAVVGGNEQVFKIVITKGAFSKTLEYVMLGNASMHSVNRSTGTPSNADLLRYYDLNRLFVSKANNNLTAVTAPTINDDSGDGYTVGSKWLDTSSSPMEIYECLDATVGAAVWANTTLTIGELGTSALVDMGTGGNQIRTNTQNEAFFEAIHVNNYVATDDPDVTNDVNEGYLVGSEWLNTASSPMELFFCLDNTAGAAVWRSSMAVDQDFGTMANLDAGTGASEFRTNAQNEVFFQPITVERTVDPTANDDENDGFIVGSVWINTTDSPPSIFTLVDDTAGSAEWQQMASYQGIATWTPTERSTPLVVNDPWSSVSVTASGSDLLLTQTESAAYGVSSNATCRFPAATEMGIYTKIMIPDDGTLVTNADFSIYLTSYENYSFASHANALIATFIKRADNTWSVQVGTNYGGGDWSTIAYIDDANVHQAVICTTFTITNATTAVIKAYAAGVLVASNTVTVADTSKFKTLWINHDNAASANLSQIAIIGSPASPIAGVTQITSTGEVDETAYPAGCANKTYLVTGLDYNLLAVTGNKVVSNGCLVSFDENENLITSTSDANSIDFYVDWSNEEVYIEDGNSYWSNGVTASTTSPSGSISTSTTSTLTTATILTPNGDKLSNYVIDYHCPAIYLESKWGEAHYINYFTGAVATGRGVKSTLVTGDVFIATGDGGVTVTGGPAKHGMVFTGASTSSAPCRVRIVARK